MYTTGNSFGLNELLWQIGSSHLWPLFFIVMVLVCIFTLAILYHFGKYKKNNPIVPIAESVYLVGLLVLVFFTIGFITLSIK